MKKAPPGMKKARRNVPVLPTILFVLSLFFIVSVLHFFRSSRSTSLTLVDLHGQSAGSRLIQSRPKAPAWCSALISHLLPDSNRASSCRDASRLPDEVNSRCGRFFSQYQQDIWIWLALAQFMDRPGFYLDVGSNNPALISNTYFFDRCLGWKGVCVEAQDKYHPGLHQHRTCKVQSCVSDKEGDIEFVHADDLGGIASLNKNVNGTEHWQDKARTAQRSKVHCVPLSKILKAERISEVTYMSLDVEGAEHLVLKGINWDTTHIAVITMEGTTQNPASRYLTDKGYILARPAAGDGFYLSSKTVQMIEQLKGKGYLQSIVISDA